MSSLCISFIIFVYISSLFQSMYIDVRAADISLQSSTVGGEYIVTFHSRFSEREQELLLYDILGSKKDWNLIKRSGPFFPKRSNFLLIRTDSQDIISKLYNNKQIIKHVFPEKRYSYALKESNNNNDDIEDYSPLRSIVPKNFTGRMSDWRDPISLMDPSDLSGLHMGRKLQSDISITDLIEAPKLWNKGITGSGVKVGIFDTGLSSSHPHFKNVKLSIDWTDEGNSDDDVGHGTFVAGIVGSNKDCLGIAPDSEIYAFKVFTSSKVSYTSWFLDAFNHAIHLGINILNLSIGGPDFNDLPFIEKVLELSANNVIVVSAIGNDGPGYGTLNNPADQLDVIGVGGITIEDKIAQFSSRGMTTWELPGGAGRVKPDLVTYGHHIKGSSNEAGCTTLSGTSVASPVVTGAIALLASSLPESIRWRILNPASVKQLLIQGATVLPDYNIFEQGYGKLDLLKSYSLLQNYVPKAILSPPTLDLTKCPYMWPYCKQPLYYGSFPTVVNMTIINGMGVTGEIVGSPQWIAADSNTYLKISFSYSSIIWPWTGYLAVHISVSEDAKSFTGIVSGVIEVTIKSPPEFGEKNYREQLLKVPLKVSIIPTPERFKRILWDQYHSLRYPSGYFPRDSLKVFNQPFDWNADHLYTNFRELFNHLTTKGYFIEILGTPYTCFDASQYGTLLVVDPEEEFYDQEDIKEGLSLIILADWYNEEMIDKIKFFDDNTKKWWTPVTGGSNIPAINELLENYKMAFGDKVYDGKIIIDDQYATFSSGSAIAAFPRGGYLIPFDLTDQTAHILSGSSDNHKVPILGLYQTDGNETISLTQLNYTIPQTGRIVIFGDSSCAEENNPATKPTCLWLVDAMVEYAMTAKMSPIFNGYSALSSDFLSRRLSLPKRVQGNQLHQFSHVLNKQLTPSSCIRDQTISTEINNRLLKSGDVDGMFNEEVGRRTPLKWRLKYSSLVLPIILLLLAIVLFIMTIWIRSL